MTILQKSTCSLNEQQSSWSSLRVYFYLTSIIARCSASPYLIIQLSLYTLHVQIVYV